MKTNLILVYSILLLVISLDPLLAQQQLQISNQNSNYKLSLEHYRYLRDSFNSLQGTTLDKTYQHLDWYEQKLLDNQNRLKYRMQRRLNRQENRYTNARYYNTPYTPIDGYDYFNNRANDWSYIIYPFALYSTLAAINAIL